MTDLATIRERIEVQVQDLRKRAEALEEDPEIATDTRNEQAAQHLPSRRSAIEGQIADLEFQADLIGAQERSLMTTSRRLQRHVERFRTEKEPLKASYTAADALIAAFAAMGAASTGAASASEKPGRGL